MTAVSLLPLKADAEHHTRGSQSEPFVGWHRSEPAMRLAFAIVLVGHGLSHLLGLATASNSRNCPS